MPTTPRDFSPIGSGGDIVFDQLEVEHELRWVRPKSRRHTLEQSAKRMFDLAFASLLLLLSLPLMGCIACIVAATSTGGPFFVQERVGMNDKRFRLFKFRTMRVGTFDDVMSNPELRAEYEANNFKLANTDAHLTPVGLFLRKASLDELPQLWNVLKGDMSMVGIRPLVPAELAQRPPVDRALYRSARPGLTGLWQVGGRSDIVGSDRLALDREYIEDWSFITDIKILARTPIAVARVDRTI